MLQSKIKRYYFVLILMSRWKPKHFIVWEAHHGPIPQGMCLTFRDFNKVNNAIENLELISKKLMVRLNLVGYWTAPPELRPSLRALAELKSKLSDVKASQNTKTREEALERVLVMPQNALSLEKMG